MAANKRNSTRPDETHLRKARRTLRASTEAEAVTNPLQQARFNKEIESSLRNLIRKGRGHFVDAGGRRR